MFVELHAKSAFSFLEATALPEALAGRAVALEQPALALVDTDGVYGAPAFYRACTRPGITPLVGAEVSLIDGGRLPLLVEDQEGYKNLCRLLTRVKMRAAKCEGAAGWDDLEEQVGGLGGLTGGSSWTVAAALAHGGHEAARATLDRLAGLFGRFGVYAELQRDLSCEQEARNEWLRAEAERLGLPLLASNAPLMIARGDRPLLDTLTCIKHGTTIDRAGRLLARNSERFLKPGREMERLFADCPSAVANTGELALRLGFTLKHLGFRSEERGEWPDIDLDLPSGDRREQVIQYVYERYGRLGAAMTANVITYRGRSAAREVGKVLGLPPALCDRLSALVSNWEYKDPGDSLLAHLREAGCDPAQPVMRHFADLWTAIQDLPRHLGQHSGGMVICQGRLDSCVPLEPATMPGRSVVQWDKDDCASMGIIKVDLLGLGMMALLEDAIGMIRRRGGHVDLAHLPPDDPTVYAMLQKADTVGVFQVDSRAQMATLPRLKPKCFYDLVVQVAIIRPGPIVGDMVHPYLRRRAGRERVTVPHPALEPILERTLGVPLFQEQLLRMAMATAGFTGGEAEELRRAFSFKRRKHAMDEVEQKLRAGMASQGITGEAAEAIIRSITAFALYGFPESHAASFALLAYASAYLKAYHPAAFYAALLNNQPMGFYHPATIVGDAARHGQVIRPADINHSDWLCVIEADGTVRLGLRYVRGLREEAGRLMERERPFSSADDLVRRAGLHRDELARLAEIGALGSLGLERRAALWEIERAARPSGPLYAGLDATPDLSPLQPMTPTEALVADYEGSGLSLGPHPMTFHRARLERSGVVRAIDLQGMRDGSPVRVAGAVVVRQRPGTAKGFVFLNLEDETGLVNVVVPPPLFHRYRLTLVAEPFLLITGVLEHREGVISVRAGRIEPLRHRLQQVPSHDFH